MMMVIGMSHAFDVEQVNYRWLSQAKQKSIEAGCDPFYVDELYRGASRSHFEVDCRWSDKRAYIWCRSGAGDDFGVECGYLTRYHEAGMARFGPERELRYEAADRKCLVRDLVEDSRGEHNFSNWAVYRFRCAEDGSARERYARCWVARGRLHCEFLQ
jgi:hypothetical protein